mgnify:CR=1 FL=1
MDLNIDPSWKKVLQKEFEKDYFVKLSAFVQNEYKSKQVFPEQKNIFNALNACAFQNVKVVLIGQDPYHNAGQAHGLCFSVPNGVKFPPSLVNVFKELERDVRKTFPQSGDLTRWAEQGVLLLNATLTVEAHKAGSHQGQGWEQFTDAIINILNEHRKNLVYLLWGSYAQGKAAQINLEKNCVLTSSHPSPLSAYRGFMGCSHFSKANNYLIHHAITPINW